MVATLLKVLTTGIQDGRIHSEPTLYPFLKVWYKVGRFTKQWVRLDFDTLPEFGRTAIVRIPRKGHLCTRLLLVTEMPDISGIQAEARAGAMRDASATEVYPKFGWTNSLGHALVQNLTLDIGGTRLEQIDSRLLEILDEYSTPLEKVTAVNRLLPRLDNGFGETSFGYSSATPTVAVTNLPFWFTRGDPGCALPIDAILADEVRIGVTFRGIEGLYYTDSRNVANGGGTVSQDQGTTLWPLAGSSFYYPDASGGTVVPGLDPSNPDATFTQVPGVQMPSRFPMSTTYILAEYIYLDQPEASRIRLADIQVPIVQHYAMKPYDTQGLPRAIVELNIPNPTRELFWMVQRQEAPTYNAHFLATRDLAAAGNEPIWWPNATGLNARYPGPLLPGFVTSDSEPVKAVGIVYEGNLVRARTEVPSLFRSVLPSYQYKKSPWLNRYYYAFSFGVLGNRTPFSAPRGEANLDKLRKRELYLEFAPNRGCMNPNDVPAYVVYVYAETYNVFRVYGGRAGCLFAY
jgi:hypothetical protein